MSIARPGLVPVARARVLLLGLYALAGLMFSAWLARLPAVRDLLGLSTAALGTVLLIGSVGSLVTVALSGIIVQRLGNARVLLVSSVVLGVGYALMGIGPGVGSRGLLAVGIFLNGVSVALSNIVLNVESARIERAVGRTVIPQFHAAFSLGAVAGSAVGALASGAGIPVTVQLPVMAVVAVCWRLVSLRGVVLPARPDEVSGPAPVAGPAPGTAARHGGALGAWREPRTLLIGVVVLAAALSEGSANTWLSLAVVDGFGRPESVGGVVLGLFVAAMTAVRLAGTRLIDRYGRVRTLRASGLVSIVGLLLFGLAPNLALAGLGVVAWGFGAALAVPIGIAAASDDPRRAAVRVAVVSTFASFAALVAPPALGLAAQSLGARHALLLVLAAMLASVAVARQVTRPVPDEEPSSELPADVTDGVGADSTGHAVRRHHPRTARRRPLPIERAGGWR